MNFSDVFIYRKDKKFYIKDLDHVRFVLDSENKV